MAITYEMFKRTFEKDEKLPDNKDQYMKALFNFYMYGRKNATDELRCKLNNLLFEE